MLQKYRMHDQVIITSFSHYSTLSAKRVSDFTSRGGGYAAHIVSGQNYEGLVAPQITLL